MCGKYLLSVVNPSERIRKFVEICNISVDDGEQIALSEFHEIRPNDSAPVLVVANCKLCATAMRWGFNKKSSGLVINARSENVAQRPMFCRLLERNRCVIPACGYFEWRDTDHQKHIVTLGQEEGMYLAGLYQMNEQGALRFVILTRSAFGAHAKVHSRMPVVLPDISRARQWMDGSIALEALAAQNLEALTIRPFGDEQLQLEW